MDNDGDKDLGPAPLQNSVLAKETFDAVFNLNEKSTSSGGNAIIAQKKITKAVQEICDGDDSCVSSYLLQLRCCFHVLFPGFTALGICSNLTRVCLSNLSVFALYVLLLHLGLVCLALTRL